MRTEVLIIDEVSMMDGDLFDKLCHIATRFRRKEGKPFGGIQLIITGDFFQLPPVDKSNRAKFAFEAASWGTCIDVTVNLTKVFRQKDTGGSNSGDNECSITDAITRICRHAQ